MHCVRLIHSSSNLCNKTFSTNSRKKKQSRETNHQSEKRYLDRNHKALVVIFIWAFSYHASLSTALIRSCSEGNGLLVSDIFGLTSGKPGTGEKMNFWRREAKTSRISAIANLFPMHIRGPNENGIRIYRTKDSCSWARVKKSCNFSIQVIGKNTKHLVKKTWR